MNTTNNSKTESGQWAIVEIMGHKVVAGYVTKTEEFGAAMLRVDVPETSTVPAFTQLYGVQSIYAVTFVSEEVARRTAEATKANPVTVYVPDLSEIPQLRNQMTALRAEVSRLRSLPSPDEGDDE